MRYLLLLAFMLSGCTAIETTCHYDAYGDHHCTKVYHFEKSPQPSTVYVVNEKPAEETIIVIEEEVCTESYWEPPIPYQAHICYPYPNGDEECEWYIGYACFETWYWDEYQCEWHYLYTYCE